MDITRWLTLKSYSLHSLQPKMNNLYTVKKNKTGADCGSDHELLIAKFRLRLKKVGKTSRLFSSVQFTRSVVSNSLWPHDELQHARPPVYHQIPKPMSNELVMKSKNLILCHPFSSCPQSFPASGSFPLSQLFASGGQSIGVSASASVLTMNIQDWSHLQWTGWNSLQSKGLSRVFSNTTVQKHKFFSAQLSL